LDVPWETNTTNSGVCGKVTQSLQLTFNDSTLTLFFNKTGKDAKNVALISITYNFSATLLPDIQSNETFSG
jgi:hypothetical protein